MSQEESQVPSAPYPPMHYRPPLKNSQSMGPHFAGGYRSPDGTNATGKSTSVRDLSDPAEDIVSRQQFEPTKAGRASASFASQIKFVPSTNVVACINTEATYSPAGVTVYNEAVQSRKLGPILMELRQVELVETNSDDDEDDEFHEFFGTRTIGVSRGNPQLGTSVLSTCMDLPVVQSYSGGTNAPIAAASGLTTGMLCIHAFGNEPDEYGMLPSSIEYYHTPRTHRQASAVAWRPNVSNHVAIGLLGSSGVVTQQSPGPRRGGTSLRAGGDREFCCFLWDIETQHAAAKRNALPVSKLSHNAPVASLAWVLDGQTLAVGSQSRNVQLYDMRASGTNIPPISAHAHQSGVHGIEVNPHKPHLMATFCRSVGEPVKLWDIRRMDSVVSEIKVSTPGTIAQSEAQGAVEAVKWSPSEQGVLSVAIGDSVHDYDTSSSSRPVLVRVNYTRLGQDIQDIALYRSPDNAKEGTNGRDGLVEALYPRRMLAVLKDRSVCDMAKHGSLAPLSISRRDGRLVHALGTKIWSTPTTSGPSAMEDSSISYDEDISATMMRRARCQRESRYSMNTSSNIRALSEDIPSGDPSSDVLLARFALLRLWTWIDRVESLSEDSEDMDGDWIWPAKGLLDAGALRLVRVDDDAPTDEISYSDTLARNVFHSSARNFALTACGWAGARDLTNVLSECEDLGEFERSAALAAWHGDIGATVEALQRASEAVRNHLEGEGHFDFPFATPQYAETLDLIAMCVAGYGGNADGPSSVWRRACSNLLQREDLSETKALTRRKVYLRALCQFLLNIGTDASIDVIIGNKYLSLCDRVAFACRFLEQEELRVYLTRCVSQCQLTGNVEGLVISGLSKEGIKILQAFVDRTADVQTAALVVSRVIFPPDWMAERKICTEWVESYRGLLNTWQMWQSRAMFDVDRSELLRRIKAKGTDTSSSRRLPTRRQGARPPDPDILAAIPAQLDVRCNFCSSPLGLRRPEGNTNQWLSKMKPILSCCPQCRKPLPRCAICLLSMGALNPYMELARERSRPGSRPMGSPDDLFSLANLPFAEWFTWCMKCKHGGHAHHLVAWFASHDSCPVSGCDCQCQFDGIQKLKRPALADGAASGLGD